MKAMLLAAGRGERMRPLTDNTPKPLLKANGISLIDFHLNKLAAAGIQNVVINTCWQADKITRHVGNGSRFNLCVEYSHEQHALETAGGVAHARHLLGDDPFLLISSDVWCEVDYSALSPIRPGQLAHLVLVDNPPHHPAGDFSLDGERVFKHSGQNTLTYSGISICVPAMFDAAHQQVMPLRKVLLPAMERSMVSGEHYRGKWMDIGTAARLSALDHWLQTAQTDISN